MGRWFLSAMKASNPREIKDQMGYHEFLVAAIAKHLRKGL